MSTQYRVLLYYKYVPIDDPETFAKQHLDFCKQLDLRGRILIAPEGINGTVSGTFEQTEQYMEHLHADPRFADMPIKIDLHDGHAFKKMHVRPKKELVTFRVDKELDPNAKTGKHLSPKQFREMLQQEDVIVLDGRNEYEYEIGHFRGAIKPQVQNFREFPEWIRENMSQFKNHKVLTYCTGGIRCEKLSAYMLDEGFEDVYQLDGGIVTYGKDPEVQGEFFDGKCYVFDQRMAVPVNQVDEVVVGRCYRCGEPAETQINCSNDLCHKQHISCETCQEQYHGYCSEACETADTTAKATSV